MQWNTKPHGRFTTAPKPWMQVNDDYDTWNAESQERDDESVLAYWRKMLKLRKDEQNLFIYGTYSMVSEQQTGADIFEYNNAFSEYMGGKLFACPECRRLARPVMATEMTA